MHVRRGLRVIFVTAVCAAGFRSPWSQRVCAPGVLGPSRQSGGCGALSNDPPVDMVVACVGGDGAGPAYDSMIRSQCPWAGTLPRATQVQGASRGLVWGSGLPPWDFVRRRLGCVSPGPLSRSPARAPRGSPLAPHRVLRGKTLFWGPHRFLRLAGPCSAPGSLSELPCKRLCQFTARVTSVPGRRALAGTPQGPLPPGIVEQGLDLRPHGLFR